MPHAGKTQVTTHASFSDFIRNASSAEKKKLYGEVLRRATERQQALLASHKAALPPKNAN